MIFPLPSIWQPHDVEDPTARIDRHLADRAYRLSAGLSVAPDFQTIFGCLIVTLGHGKFIRLHHASGSQTQVADSVAKACREACRSDSTSSGRVQAIADLANSQALAIEDLKRQAGKYVDRILAVAVTDPGGWALDFDGRQSYWSMCDAIRLAELSGLNIVDAIPSRDLAVGGTGVELEALPYWLLFADRDLKLATGARAVINVAEQTRAFYLPPSDGLDAELPEIRFFNEPGERFLRGLAKRLLPDGFERQNLEPLNADGRRIEPLIQQWESIISESEKATNDQSHSASHSRSEMAVALDRRLHDAAERFIQSNPNSLSSVIRSAFVLISTRLSRVLSDAAKGRTAIDRVWVAADRDVKAGMINQFSKLIPASQVLAFDGINPGDEASSQSSELSAIVAAMLGLMHVDQMPSNVPWLTGGDGMRILGRLTPGKPSHWRRLVMEMADFRPPAMRLKDAI